MKISYILVCAIALKSGPLLAQTASQFTFKGNYLGMPLAEFKTKNLGESVFINTGKPKWNGRADKKYTLEVPTPLCTDEYQGFPGDPGNEVPNEVVCNPSPGGERNRVSLQFAGVQAESLFYRFYGQSLYEIEIHLTSHDYGEARAAFVQKYGPPSRTSSETYQNGFGASWTGEILYWDAGTKAIVLNEGSGNGPGQNSRSIASRAGALFLDTSIAPPNNTTKPVDF